MNVGSGVYTCSNSSASVGFAAITLANTLAYFTSLYCSIPEPWPQSQPVQNLSSFDFIIVGAGSAGSTLAARLADHHKFKVLVLEAGGDPPIESYIPGMKDLLKGSCYDWKFSSVSDEHSSHGLQNNSQKFHAGKMLGGSDSMNDMVHSHGFPSDFYSWADAVGSDWNWTTVLPYLKKFEKMVDENIVNNSKFIQSHGVSGEIYVQGTKKVRNFAIERFLDAFKELGFNIVDDMTDPNKIGAGRFSHTIKDGKRHNAYRAILRKVKQRENLVVLTNAFVTKILFENNKARGVKLTIDNNDYEFLAKNEVIISTGAYNTPKLLLLSGIGPKEHLNDLKIDVVKDLEKVGNMFDHTMVLTYLKADEGTCKYSSQNLYKNLIDYLYEKSGPLSHSESMGVYISLDQSKNGTPDFAIYPSCAPKGSNFYFGCSSILGYTDEICIKLNETNKKHEIITLALVHFDAQSSGYVHLRSKNPFDPPLIYPRTFDDLNDLDKFPEAMKIALSLVNTSYFKDKNAEIIDISLNVCQGKQKNEAFKCFARQTATSAYHPAGTAALGSVLDNRLKIKGLEGIRVVDASVFPRKVTGNINSIVVMIAERAAKFIMEDYTNK